MSHRSLTVHRPIQTLSTSQIPPFLGRSQATRSPDFYAHRKPNPPIHFSPCGCGCEPAVPTPNSSQRSGSVGWWKGRFESAEPPVPRRTTRSTRRESSGGAGQVVGRKRSMTEAQRRRIVRHTEANGRNLTTWGSVDVDSGGCGWRRRPLAGLTEARRPADRQEIIRGSSTGLKDAGFRFWMNWKMHSNGLEMQVWRRVVSKREHRGGISRSSRHVWKNMNQFLLHCAGPAAQVSSASYSSFPVVQQ